MESITSGYGIGPTDRKGRPLFGLAALRVLSKTKSMEEADSGISSETSIKLTTQFHRDFSNNTSKRPVFGLKALQRKNDYDNDEFCQSKPNFSNHLLIPEKYDSNSLKSHSLSNDNELSGKMIATQSSYEKAEGGGVTMKTTMVTQSLDPENEKLNTSNRKPSPNKRLPLIDCWKSGLQKISNENVEKSQNKQNKEVDIDRIWNEDQLRNLLDNCSDYESRRLVRARLRSVMADDKKANAEDATITDVVNSDDNHVTQINGECKNVKTQRSQSSPSSIIEDSGTESGEDLRLLNPELLAEVRGALSKLECALPTLDTVRRASIIPLVNKLQSCLKLNDSTAPHSTLPNKRMANRIQQRKNRHTVGVSREELADARRWLAENCVEQEDDENSIPATLSRQNSASSIPMKYESNKTYKPVKFTPNPPRENKELWYENKYPIEFRNYEKPKSEKCVVKEIIKPMFAYRAYVTPTYNKQFSEEQLRKENCSSDEGDVSSTEEESMNTDMHRNNLNKSYGVCEPLKKVPVRFQKNNKKIRMKRANTIDIPKLMNCENMMSSGDESVSRSADELERYNMMKMEMHTTGTAPCLQVKTEKDRKFAQFLEKTKQEDLRNKTVTYNPNAAGGAQWSNRFSHIKTAFEQGHNNISPSSPEDMSKMFRPIRKVASFPKPAPTENTFTHALKSPFKPVAKAASIYDMKPNASPEYFHQQHPEKQSVYSGNSDSGINAPKTYYTPIKETKTSQTTSKTPDKNEKNSTYSENNLYNVRTVSSSSRLVKANSVTSPFSTFRQLDRQNSMPSSVIPTNKFTDHNLVPSASSIKERLLNWVKAQTREYENVQIDNFSTSWNNGLAFCALIHHFCPCAFDYGKLSPDQRRYNFELAFKVAEDEAGIYPLLDVEDMVRMKRPDWKCVFTYVQTIYQKFHASPKAVQP